MAGNGPDLLAIHRASRINLQLMPAGFVHQRALDGLAGGGFFLARAIPYDLAGDVVEPLIARLDALGLTTSDQLASCRDAELIQLLSRYLGQPFEPRWATDPAVLPSLRILREIVHPVRAFPRFKHILFDDADSFSLLADRFLTDDALRTDIAKEMRCGVLTHYTYEATMQRFLTGMTDWLNARATNT